MESQRTDSPDLLRSGPSRQNLVLQAEPAIGRSPEADGTACHWWVHAGREVERNKCINALCAPVPRGDWDIFKAPAEFKAKLHAVKQPYVEPERQFRKLEDAKSRTARRSW